MSLIPIIGILTPVIPGIGPVKFLLGENSTLEYTRGNIASAEFIKYINIYM